MRWKTISWHDSWETNYDDKSKEGDQILCSTSHRLNRWRILHSAEQEESHVEGYFGKQQISEYYAETFIIRQYADKKEFVERGRLKRMNKLSKELVHIETKNQVIVQNKQVNLWHNSIRYILTYVE